MRRVVVTGLGAITPIGNSVSQMWESVKASKCGIDKITLFDTTDRKVTLAGEVKNYVPEAFLDKREARKMDRYVQFAMAAANEAMKDAGLDMEKEDTSRCGCIVSSGIGGLGTIEAEDKKGMEKGYDRVSPHFIPMVISNMAAGNIAIAYGFHGMCTCPVTACASGTNAIGDAFRQIRDGYADVMICGGSEASITPLGIGGFTSLKALSQAEDPKRASIPFDKERSGFVMGEGAGIIILEELEHAKKRGAKIYAEIVGYGASSDAYHITSPAPEGEGGARAMVSAIKDANIAPSEITYINAHGTSTHLNDSCETSAIKTALGIENAKKVLVSSTKGNTGHLLGAAGGVEAIACIKAIEDSFVPPTINYKVPDEECDLDIVPNVGRNMDVKYAMSNSLGFGGHNSSIIFKKYED